MRFASCRCMLDDTGRGAIGSNIRVVLKDLLRRGEVLGVPIHDLGPQRAVLTDVDRAGPGLDLRLCSPGIDPLAVPAANVCLTLKFVFPTQAIARPMMYAG